ncbi:hypothetical protein CW304_08280 [Bacillus sp. UFRGS-B20]|nr:hypothetical protein CW304_08280 [Bacillus sp. UFRGS-B20]
MFLCNLVTDVYFGIAQMGSESTFLPLLVYPVSIVFYVPTWFTRCTCTSTNPGAITFVTSITSALSAVNFLLLYVLTVLYRRSVADDFSLASFHHNDHF